MDNADFCYKKDKCSTSTHFYLQVHNMAELAEVFVEFGNVVVLSWNTS